MAGHPRLESSSQRCAHAFDNASDATVAIQKAFSECYSAALSWLRANVLQYLFAEGIGIISRGLRVSADQAGSSNCDIEEGWRRDKLTGRRGMPLTATSS